MWYTGHTIEPTTLMMAWFEFTPGLDDQIRLAFLWQSQIWSSGHINNDENGKFNGEAVSAPKYEPRQTA